MEHTVRTGSATAAQTTGVEVNAMQGTFKIHGPAGEVREIQGDSTLLTLQDAVDEFGKESGKQGGDWTGARVRVNGREYSGKELERTFQTVGVIDGGELSILT